MRVASLLLVLFGCAHKAPPPEPPPGPVVSALDALDWAAIEAETVELLSMMIRHDTRNPPGAEHELAVALGEWLGERGVASEVWPMGDGRSNLVARVPGTSDKAPLCLLSHLDVAEVEADRWEHDPFSGDVIDGEIWGRGALDMKGVGAVHAQIMALVAQGQVQVDRELVLLAVADEEVDNQGAKAVAERWSEIGCSHLLNEGGMGIRDALFDGETLFGISVAEKGALWLRVSADGPPGHGSTVTSGESPENLLKLVDRLEKYKPKDTVPDSLLMSFQQAGTLHGGLIGSILRTPWAVKSLAMGKLRSNDTIRATLRNTVHLTGFGGAMQPNVVPGTSWFQLDIRLLPGIEPAAFLDETIRPLLGDAAEIEVLHAQVGNQSPVDDPLFIALTQFAVEGRDDAAAGPILSPGFTDSIYFRELGVHAYGFAPFEVTVELGDGFHGDNERLPVEELPRGVRRLLGAILLFDQVG